MQLAGYVCTKELAATTSLPLVLSRGFELLTSLLLFIMAGLGKKCSLFNFSPVELYLALKAGLVADWWDWVLADDWLDLVQISRSGLQSLDGCDWWHLDPCADWWDLDP